MENMFLILLFPALVMQGSMAQSLYTYKAGLPNSPPNWGNIQGIPNNQCGGSNQSPIDIVTRSANYVSKPCDKYMDYKFMTGNCTYDQVEFKITDHNIEVEYKDGCKKDTVILPDIPNEVFELAQFHIHIGTEHSFDGFLNAGELHMVHKSTGTSGKLAVVGLVFQVGLAQDNPFFRKLLNEWQKVAEENPCGTRRSLQEGGVQRRRVQNHEVLGIYDFMPTDEAYYRYEGSLTTPPCTEIVHWSVASKPIQISSVEEREFIDLILNFKNPDNCALGTIASEGGSTGRPQQSLNGRSTTFICPTKFDPCPRNKDGKKVRGHPECDNKKKNDGNCKKK